VQPVFGTVENSHPSIDNKEMGRIKISLTLSILSILTGNMFLHFAQKPLKEKNFSNIELIKKLLIIPC